MDERTHQMTLVAQNRSAAPMTVKIQAVFSGLKAAPELPLVAELAPRESRALVVFTKLTSWKLRYWSQWSRGSASARQDTQILYRLPWQKGRFKVIQGWGGRFSHDEPHSFYAVDFAMPQGTPVVAARAGRVAMVRMDSTQGCGDKRCIEEANYVVIEHDDGTLGEYFHLMPHSARVKVDDQVQVGQVLALSGNTGFSTEPHLHFVVKTANKDARPQSLPFKFETAQGPVFGPVPGHWYSAAGDDNQALGQQP
ncbi:M23 family metallopeptidase [Gallaecimonas kandeliae]|uniref:M23 family metallopeptidase n=1 Tax=Gallaecimonas kandeliae TaxID=3029055 RepID=UPI0026496AB2|nr:M23 family metallopeptidase [Gallaecimonas kandeliae]WKE63929.1 M23 family metallopeptidase [Gallaecimonas kandeliae]